MSFVRGEGTSRWTPEQRAAHKAIREKFQAERPTLQQLIGSGEYVGPIPHGVYLSFRQAVSELRKVRESAGLSLADVSERSGIDKAALSRLETGVSENPTLETLTRYASALGRQFTWKLTDLPSDAAV